MDVSNAIGPVSQAFASQDKSPLFTKLPAEIRLYIFELCVATCEDIKKRYPRNALWNRPGHYGPRTVYTDILRTCKQAHHEAWFLPWKNTSLTIYLAALDRRPPGAVNPYFLEEQLSSLTHAVEFADLQIFAQLYMLEPGYQLQSILGLPNFSPRRLTVTIRHTDCWEWEDNNKLRIAADWVNTVSLPDSVQEVVVKVETPERKQMEVEWLNKEMVKSWHFTRSDGSKLLPTEPTSERWTGSSTLNHHRWIRDETQPGLINYYIGVVTFKLSKDWKDLLIEAPDLEVPEELATLVDDDVPPCISLEALREANVPAGASTRKALRMIDRHVQGRRHQTMPGAHEDDQDEWESTDEDGDLDDGDHIGDEATTTAATVLRSNDLARHQRHIRAFHFNHGPQPAAIKEKDELADDDIIDEDRSMNLMLPGSYHVSSTEDRFGPAATGYEYQLWKRRFIDWRREARTMTKAAAESRRATLFDFWMPPNYCDPFSELRGLPS